MGIYQNIKNLLLPSYTLQVHNMATTKIYSIRHLTIAILILAIWTGTTSAGQKCHKGNVKCVESVWFGRTYGPDKCILGRYGPWCASKVDGSKVYMNDGWNWFCEDC